MVFVGMERCDECGCSISGLPWLPAAIAAGQDKINDGSGPPSVGSTWRQHRCVVPAGQGPQNVCCFRYGDAPAHLCVCV